MTAIDVMAPLPSFLRWLVEPSATSGIHVSDGNGGWEGSSYRELADAAHALARGLDVGAGPRPSSVAVCGERADDVLVAAGASWLLGAPIHVVPAPHAFPSPDAHRAVVLRNLPLAATDAIIAGRGSEELADEIAAGCEPGRRPRVHGIDERHPGDPLAVQVPMGATVHQFTSGSTGASKLIRVSAANLTANLDGQARWLGWRDGVDAWASWLPLNHDMGLIGGLFVPMTRQSDLWAATPRQFLRDPWTWLEPLGDGRATVTAAPSFGYGYAAARLEPGRESGADFSAWRAATIGAELVSPAVLRTFSERFGARGFVTGAFCPAYGMAECTLAATCVLPGDPVRAAPIRDAAGWAIGRRAPLGAPAAAPGSAALLDDALICCGPPVAGFDIRVVDEDGVPLSEGFFGEIELRGTSIAEVSANALLGTTPVSSGGAVRTGDGGVLLDGELYVVGRLGDGLKVRGAFVDCEGLEQRLIGALGLPTGRAALALGQLGDEVHAVLAVRRRLPSVEAGLSRAQRLVRAAAGHDARLHVVAVGARGLAKTSSGKPQRQRIWEHWIEGRSAAEREYVSETKAGSQI